MWNSFSIQKRTLCAWKLSGARAWPRQIYVQQDEMNWLEPRVESLYYLASQSPKSLLGCKVTKQIMPSDYLIWFVYPRSPEVEPWVFRWTFSSPPSPPPHHQLWGLGGTVLCTVLYCTCIVLYCTVLYCTLLYCTVLYCTVLYCIVLYCTVQYLTVKKIYNNPTPQKKSPPKKITPTQKKNNKKNPPPPLKKSLKKGG